MNVQSSNLPFDQVLIELGPGETARYGAQAFLDMPLHERVSLILGRQVRFLSRGQTVPASQALRALREAASR
jgi:hypothetical protein